MQVTLGSDDPPYFGASIGGEYEVCAEQMGLGGPTPCVRSPGTGIDAAFCEESLKDSLRSRV